MVILPVALTAAAAAAIINVWLSMRIGEMRHRLKIDIGDGGNEILRRRMRAQLNFAENTLVVVPLLALVEMARLGNPWLMPVGAIYILGRVLHALGMDGGALSLGRSIGTIVTLLTQIGLAVWAISIVADM